MQPKRGSVAKWIFDRSAAFVGLVGLAPFMAVIAAVVWVQDPNHSFIFRQKRIGQYGKPFTFYKFRTMKAQQGGSSVTVRNDARLTKIGKFLRRYKLDELPQLWNVLKGDMSFVGPRPDVEGYANKLQGDDRIILELKPGITGPATIKYRNEEDLLAAQENPLEYNDKVIWPNKVWINKEYARERTFMRDIKIILKTINLLK